METHALGTLGSCAAGTVVWRHRGGLRLTVVAKACFSFDAAGVLTRVDSPPFARQDLHIGNQPLASVEQPSDRVPRRKLDELVVVGAARAPAGKPVEQMWVRLLLERGEQRLIDKILEVVGDERDGKRRPFDRMPLGYERSYGGMGIRANPIGRVLSDGGGNVRYAQKPAHVAGFGPVAMSWLTRAPLAEGASGLSAEAADPAPLMVLPDSFDFSFFQCAPSDQHVAGLTIGDRITLQGFFAEVPHIAFELPDYEAACVVFGADGVDDSPRRLLLNLDLVTIHTEQRTVTLSWRGSLPVQDMSALARVAVAAGVFRAGQLPELPSQRQQLAALPVAEQVAAAAVDTLSELDLQTLPPAATRTLPLRPRVAADSDSQSPFPLAHGESSSASALPDAPWSHQAGAPVLPPVAGAALTLDPFSAPPMPTVNPTQSRLASHASAALAADAPPLMPPAGASSDETLVYMPQDVAAAATLPPDSTTLLPRSVKAAADPAASPLMREMVSAQPPVRQAPQQAQRVPGAPWSQESIEEVQAPGADQAATLDVFAHQALAAQAARAARSQRAEPAAASAARGPASAQPSSSQLSSSQLSSSQPSSPQPSSPQPSSSQADSSAPSTAGAEPAASAADDRDGRDATEPRWAPIDKVSHASEPKPRPSAPRKLNVAQLLYGKKDK